MSTDLLVHLYPGLVLAWVIVALLLLVQVLVADVVGLRRGHVPGAEVDGGHADLLWRARRAYANTNETLGVFVLLTLAAVAVDVHPVVANGLALVYALGRVGHMLCYWFDLRLARSISWVVAALALAGLATAVFVAW